jgi:hypothetical protein
MKTTPPRLSFAITLARVKMVLWPVAPEHGCHWIERDDYLDRIHRGEEIYCNVPVRHFDESYCAAHRARAYVDPRSPLHEIDRRSELARGTA